MFNVYKAGSFVMSEILKIKFQKLIDKIKKNQYEKEKIIPKGVLLIGSFIKLTTDL